MIAILYDKRTESGNRFLMIDTHVSMQIPVVFRIYARLSSIEKCKTLVLRPN